MFEHCHCDEADWPHYHIYVGWRQYVTPPFMGPDYLPEPGRDDHLQINRSPIFKEEATLGSR